MANPAWETLKVCFCNRAKQEVRLEALVVYPAEWMPETPPRVNAHRCSNAIACNFDDQSGCTWSGTNPLIDPFLDHT